MAAVVRSRRRQRTQALGEAGVVGEQAEGLGVAEDRDARPGRQRLASEQQARVDQFGDRVDPDHAGLAQQRADRGVRAIRVTGTA